MKENIGQVNVVSSFFLNFTVYLFITVCLHTVWYLDLWITYKHTQYTIAFFLPLSNSTSEHMFSFFFFKKCYNFMFVSFDYTSRLVYKCVNEANALFVCLM